MFLAVECLLVYRKDIAAQTDCVTMALSSPENGPTNRFHLAFSCAQEHFLFLTVRLDSLQSLYPPEGKERTTLIIKKERAQRKDSRGETVQPSAGSCKLLHIPEKLTTVMIQSTVTFSFHLQMLSNIRHERLCTTVTFGKGFCRLSYND